MESDGDEKRAVIGYTKTRAAEVLEHLRAEASVQTEKLAAEQKRSEEELACQLIESEKNRTGFFFDSVAELKINLYS